MRSSELFLALAPAVLATPVIRSQDSQQVHIILERSKETSQAAITVWNIDQDEVVAKSCSDSLTSGGFEKHPVAFNVDDTGAGDLTVGDASYVIGGGDAANAIECGRIASEIELIVNCVVSIPSSVELRALDKRGLRECFADGPLSIVQAMNVLEGKAESKLPADVVLPDQVDVDDIVERDVLDKRQCGLWGSGSRLVGNGNPHQNPLNIQLSEPMQCPGHIGCSTYHTTTRSFSIGWHANGGVPWISGGFAVVQTIETGNSYVCNGNPNDYFAVWKNQAQTAYTVESGLYNTCNGSWVWSGRHFIIWSPNANNRRGYYYCVYGRGYVRAQGDRWLDTAAHTPGGP